MKAINAASRRLCDIYGDGNRPLLFAFRVIPEGGRGVLRILKRRNVKKNDRARDERKCKERKGMKFPLKVKIRFATKL